MLPIGNLAQQELKSVVIQLQQQLDMIDRIERLEQKYNELLSNYRELQKKTSEFDEISTRQASMISRINQLESTHKLNRRNVDVPTSESEIKKQKEFIIQPENNQKKSESKWMFIAVGISMMALLAAVISIIFRL